MSKYLGGGVTLLAGVFIFGLVLGFNWGGLETVNIWPKDRDGLYMLNKSMASDKSERLGIVVITEQNQYQTVFLPEGYFIQSAIMKKVSQ